MVFQVIALSVLLGATLLLAVIGLRIRAVIDPRRPKPHRDANVPSHLMLVLGSGGHTAEMIAMLQRAVGDEDPKARLNWAHFTHRNWIVSSGDALSAKRAKDFEDLADAQHGTYDIKVVPRAREIHQPLYTAPVSSLRCLATCVSVLNAGQHDFPDVILCNGPATATIMVFTSIILRFFNIRTCHDRGKMRTIYVESFARVQKLSLSGRLLSAVVDRFLVQWPQLVKASGRAEYCGIVV